MKQTVIRCWSAVLISLRHRAARVWDIVLSLLNLFVVFMRLVFPAPQKKVELVHDVVVSLTSFPPRFSTLKWTIISLLQQKLLPQKIILWIAHEDAHLIPSNIKLLVGDIFEIRLTEDLRSYKKIIPTLREFPRAVIVTADDDVFYFGGWLQGLIAGHIQYPDASICYRAHKIKLTPAGVIEPYQGWQLGTSETTPSQYLFPVGIGGVLYPPGFFSEEVLNISSFMGLAPKADDVWLFWMGRLNGRISVRVRNRQRFVPWIGSQTNSLFKSNIHEGGNDVQIRSLQSYYGVPSCLMGEIN